MVNEKWYIILNPVAGGKKAQRVWPKMESYLRQIGLAFEVYPTTHRGHATELAESIVAAGGRHLLAVGGDGTNSEVCEGIMRQKAVSSAEITYGLIPCGRGNDWSRSHGFTCNMADLVKKIQAGQTHFQDMGLVRYVDKSGNEAQRHFVNVAGMAYDGNLVKISEETRGGIRGQLHYQLMILRCLAGYKAPKGVVSFGDKRIEDEFYLINVGICPYSGGGMRLVPHAKSDDGLLALMVVKKVPKYEVILQTPRFYNGTLGSHRAAEAHQTRSLDVEHSGSQAIWLEVDGEFIGYSPASFSIIDGALRVLG